MRECVLKEMYNSRGIYTEPHRPGSIDAKSWDKFIPNPGSAEDPLSGDWSDPERMDEWWALMTHLAARGPGGSSRSSAQYDAIMVLLADLKYFKLSKATGAKVYMATSTGNAIADTALLQSFFRASQICAHDRYRLARGGWGRLSLGLYALFYHKWLEYYPPSSFHWLRLENYNGHERSHLAGVFEFLGISSGSASSRELDETASGGGGDDSFWHPILEGKPANVNHRPREPMWEETEAALRKFYLPYNILLARFIIEGHQSRAGTRDEGVKDSMESVEAYLYEKMSKTSV